MNSPLTRRQFLQTAAAATALPAVVRAADSEISSVGSEWQLFLDDLLVDTGRTRGVTRRLNPPTAIERVLKPEQPSEALGFIFYCSVVDDNGTAKLFH
ncbi:MAG: twin-arginine translocation signal domain-containing protein, partial [Gimesia chilikensis]